MNDRHVGAQLHHVFDEVGGKKHDHVLADVGKQARKTVALAGIEPAVGRPRSAVCGFPVAPARSQSVAACPRKIQLNAFLR